MPSGASSGTWRPPFSRSHLRARSPRSQMRAAKRQGGSTMDSAYDQLHRSWNPWSFIPPEYNLGVALTKGQVLQGRGDKPALLWENASGQAGTFTYGQLDALTNRLASSLRRLGIGCGDRVFLRLPN